MEKMDAKVVFVKEGYKGPVLLGECPKLHLTTGLRKGREANKNAILLNLSTLAFLFRKATPLSAHCGPRVRLMIVREKEGS